jgi:hypothetical protein
MKVSILADSMGDNNEKRERKYSSGSRGSAQRTQVDDENCEYIMHRKKMEDSRVREEEEMKIKIQREIIRLEEQDAEKRETHIQQLIRDELSKLEKTEDRHDKMIMDEMKHQVNDMTPRSRRNSLSRAIKSTRSPRSSPRERTLSPRSNNNTPPRKSKSRSGSNTSNLSNSSPTQSTVTSPPIQRKIEQPDKNLVPKLRDEPMAPSNAAPLEAAPPPPPPPAPPPPPTALPNMNVDHNKHKKINGNSKRPVIEKGNGLNQSMSSLMDELKKVKPNSEKRMSAIIISEELSKSTPKIGKDPMSMLFQHIKKIQPDSEKRLTAVATSAIKRRESLIENRLVIDKQLQSQRGMLKKTSNLDTVESNRSVFLNFRTI